MAETHSSARGIGIHSLSRSLLLLGLLLLGFLLGLHLLRSLLLAALLALFLVLLIVLLFLLVVVLLLVIIIFVVVVVVVLLIFLFLFLFLILVLLVGLGRQAAEVEPLHESTELGLERLLGKSASPKAHKAYLINVSGLASRSRLVIAVDSGDQVQVVIVASELLDGLSESVAVVGLGGGLAGLGRLLRLVSLESPLRLSLGHFGCEDSARPLGCC